MLSEKASSTQSQRPPSLQESKRKYAFVHGDNLAENRLAGIDQKLQRVQLKGRSGPGRASIDMLFAAFLLRQSGLDAVLDALSCTGGFASQVFLPVLQSLSKITIG